MRRTPRLIAAAAVVGALILSACGSSDSAPKQRNSAIAQPGEGLNITVYKIRQGQGNAENTPTLGYADFRKLVKFYAKEEPCAGANTTVANIEQNWDQGVIENCQKDFVLIHYTGFITIPGEVGTNVEVKFQNQSDDGFQLEIEGNELINDWSIKPCQGKVAKVSLPAGKKLKFEAWYFENMIHGCNYLNWALPGFSKYQIVPPSAFSLTDTTVSPEENTTSTTSTTSPSSTSTSSTSTSEPMTTTTVKSTTTTVSSKVSSEVVTTTSTSTLPEDSTTSTTVASVDKQVIVDDTTPITVPDGSTDLPCDAACVDSIRTTLGVSGDVYATVNGTKVLLDGKTPIPANGSSVVFSDGADKSVTVALETVTADTTATTDTSSGDDSSFPWWIIIVAIVVLAGGGYVAATRKKKKD